eukprot:s4235_g9.t2
MSNKANLEPFHLTPDGMYTIMGGLKIGGYRSAMQYLDLAKQEHIRLGHSSLAYRVCARSCKRGLGSAKQAAALPLERLREIGEDRCWVPAGPVQPVKSTIVASWWLLRELEASRSRVRHITVDFASRTVSRLLPSSKTDVAALGTTRRHSCSCSVLPAGLCPFHLVADLIKDKGPNEPVFTDLGGAPPSKAGWADTFQELARLLGIPTCWPNGARAFTGHSARATSAQYLASHGIELWRVQIFGRWGSDAILGTASGVSDRVWSSRRSCSHTSRLGVFARPGAASLEKHRLARGAVEAFRDWFSGASVAAYVNLAEFETNAPKDLRLDLILQLDAERVELEDCAAQLRAGRLASDGLFFHLCGCDGHGTPDCEDGSSCQRLFRRLLSARCEGSAWFAGAEVLFEPPQPEERCMEHRSRVATSSPRGRAASAGLRLLRVVAEGVHRGVVAIRDAPKLDGAILGVKRRGDYVVAELEEPPWVQLSIEDDWLAEFSELRRLEGEAAPINAWMLQDGATLGFGVLLASE